jgi:hypothetical protein
MQGEGPLDFLPLWGFFAVTLLVVLLSVEGGLRLGDRRRKRAEPEKEGPVSAVVGATLGLLGLLLAFTFNMAASRFDLRRQTLLEEVNAIGTTYLRAGLLPEPHRTEVRQLLREYVDVRLEGIQQQNVEAIRRSEELHGQLWAQAVAVAEKAPGSIMAGLFIQALNEVIDLHSKRVMVSLRNRIPGPIWAVLYGVAFLCMSAMGYHTGLAESRRSLALLTVCLAFTVVMFVIADLDRPQKGLLKVSQQGMIELRSSMTDPHP